MRACLSLSLSLRKEERRKRAGIWGKTDGFSFLNGISKSKKEWKKAAQKVNKFPQFLSRMCVCVGGCTPVGACARVRA